MLADAGLRVGVAIAPILPGITDAESSLREVYAAAAEAGASQAWHSVLNLNEIARESYFGFLRAEFPSLVDRHEIAYRSKYAPKAMVADIDARVDRAKSGIRFRSRATIAAQPRRVQLSLLDGPLLL
jgi:DNA repair photolyase